MNNQIIKSDVYELTDFAMSKKDENILKSLQPHTFSQFNLYIKTGAFINKLK